MKNTLSIVTLLLLAVTGFAQKQEVKLKLANGASYYQSTTSNMKMTQEVQGQEIIINMNITGKMKFTVTGIRDSIYSINMQYESLAMKMEMPQGDVAFSSEDTDPNNMMSQILSGIKKSTIAMELSNTGRVVSVKDSERLFANNPVLDKLPEEQRKQIIAQLSESYGEKAFKGNLEMTMNLYAPAPVAKGETWVKKGKLDNKMTMDVVYNYQLQDVTPEYYIISCTSNFKSPADSPAVVSGGMEMKFDMSGTMTSTFKVLKSTGWIASATLNQSLKGNSEIKASDMVPGGMSIPMTITNSMTLTDY